MFSEEGVEWDVSLTKKAGDGRKLAEKAAAQGVDILAVYGGDGTVVEAASGLVGTDVPLAILPGGTSNMVARELNIPRALDEAGKLVSADNSNLHPVDMGLLNDRQFFIQRIGVGLDAEMIQAASRELKDRFGNVAYLFGGLLALKNPSIADYRLTLDGEELERNGVFCMVSNTGKIGISDLKTYRNIDISDGLLDVIIFQKTDWQSIQSKLIGSIRPNRKKANESSEIQLLDHWQAKNIVIEVDPPQLFHIDGDVSGQTPLRIEVIPHAVTVIVPSAPSNDK